MIMDSKYRVLCIAPTPYIQKPKIIQTKCFFKISERTFILFYNFINKILPLTTVKGTIVVQQLT